jgi:hypothetical protein
MLSLYAIMYTEDNGIDMHENEHFNILYFSAIF